MPGLLRGGYRPPNEDRGNAGGRMKKKTAYVLKKYLEHEDGSETIKRNIILDEDLDFLLRQKKYYEDREENIHVRFGIVKAS